MNGNRRVAGGARGGGRGVRHPGRGGVSGGALYLFLSLLNPPVCPARRARRCSRPLSPRAERAAWRACSRRWPSAVPCARSAWRQRHCRAVLPAPPRLQPPRARGPGRGLPGRGGAFGAAQHAARGRWAGGRGRAGIRQRARWRRGRVACSSARGADGARGRGAQPAQEDRRSARAVYVACASARPAQAAHAPAVPRGRMRDARVLWGARRAAALALRAAPQRLHGGRCQPQVLCCGGDAASPRGARAAASAAAAADPAPAHRGARASHRLGCPTRARRASAGCTR